MHPYLHASATAGGDGNGLHFGDLPASFLDSAKHRNTGKISQLAHKLVDFVTLVRNDTTRDQIYYKNLMSCGGQ